MASQKVAFFDSHLNALKQRSAVLCKFPPIGKQLLLLLRPRLLLRGRHPLRQRLARAFRKVPAVQTRTSSLCSPIFPCVVSRACLGKCSGFQVQNDTAEKKILPHRISSSLNRSTPSMMVR